jgi:signal transduction histidine kinase/CheY-like chemotaxis protein
MLSNNGELQFAAVSLFPVMLAINLIYGTILWALFRKDNSIAVNFWIKGCFYFCLGTFLIAIRFHLPLFLGYALGNFFVAYSHLMCLQSMESLTSKLTKKHYVVKFLCLLYGVGFIPLKYNDMNPDVMALYIGISTLVLHFWIFSKLINLSKKSTNLFAKLITYCYLISSVIWLFRIFLSQYYGFGESMDPGFINWLTLLMLTLIFPLKHSFFFGLELIQKNNQLKEVTLLSKEKDELLIQLATEKNIAEKANLTKNQFLANVSHEIRTPLHGLIGLLSIVLRSPMSEEIKKSLDKALYSSKALLHVLNDILSFSKIEAGVIDINREPLRLQQLFDDVSDLFSISAVNKKIDLRFDLDPKIPEILIGDFFKLRQVLFNLVGNSIKFTRHGFIEVKANLEYIDHQTASIIISVKDTGIGISAEFLEDIFQPFRQIDNSSTRNYDGLGLGLPIAQSILKMMKSQLIMKSQPGIGTEVSFLLSLETSSNVQSDQMNLKSEGREINLTSLQLESLVGKRVLVAEDNPINIEVIGHYLEFLKMDAHFVQDGHQCLEELARDAYDIVLMDIQMPNLDGVHTTIQIRLMERLKELPIVGLSAAISQEDREKSLRSGMSDYLVKPFELETLAQMIFKYINPKN